MWLSRWARNFAFSVITIIAAVLLLQGCDDEFAKLNRTETSGFHVVGDRLYLDGTINSQSLQQFEEIYAAHSHVRTLVQLNVPGSIDDEAMIELAYRVRDLGLNTHLTATSHVNSGGVDLFLAGIRRTMEPGARLGVHEWTNGRRNGRDYRRGAPQHELYRSYTEEMLGSDKFYWFTLEAAPPDDIYYLSPAEIRDFGLLTG